MPIKPKQYPRRVLSQKGKQQTQPCKNPSCTASVPVLRNKKKQRQYCDTICQREHREILKLERRPKDVRCANLACGKLLDPLSRDPCVWRTSKHHFCDELCADEYRRETGFYVKMSKRGNESIQAYIQKHGKVHASEKRSLAVIKNNQTTPPRNKNFVRHGYVWGYTVNFYPNEDGSGYRVSIAELPEVGILQTKTKKEGLLQMRQKMLEIREIERREQADFH